VVDGGVDDAIRFYEILHDIFPKIIHIFDTNTIIATTIQGDGGFVLLAPTTPYEQIINAAILFAQHFAENSGEFIKNIK